MSLKPIGNRILVQTITAPTVVEGLYLPDTYEAKGNRRASIVAVGGSVEEPGLVVGAQVLFTQYGGVEVKDPIQGTLYLLDADSVLGIIA